MKNLILGIEPNGKFLYQSDNLTKLSDQILLKSYCEIIDNIYSSINKRIVIEIAHVSILPSLTFQFVCTGVGVVVVAQ